MSYITSKIKDNIRKYGFFTFLKRAVIKIKHIIIEKVLNIVCREKYIKDLNEILNQKKYLKIFVMFPFFDFNMPNFQRFQQLAIALGKEEDTLFFYCSPNNIYDGIYGFKNIVSNLYLTNQYELLINYKIENRVMYFVSTDTKSTLKDIKESVSRKDVVVYDYVDEIHEDIVGKYSSDVILKHKYALGNEDIYVVATADKLLEDIEKTRKNNVSLITNGVSLKDFIISGNNYSSNKLTKLIQFKKNKKVTIGYYGALAKWFDYELIKEIAKDKNIGIILIGIDYDKTFQESGIGFLENVVYLGSIEYKNLKYYANEIDILTIPFLVNDITNATSPVKLFEYMAMKKPVITSNLKECRKYKSVKIAKDSEDFIKLIYEIINLNKNQKVELETTLYNDAISNSWPSKAKAIVDLIN